MALTDENGVGFNMPVAPAYSMPYGGNYGGGLFGNGGDSWLGILFLIALCNGGFGFGGFGGWGGMMGMGMMDGFGLYPWLNNSQNINDGFRAQELSSQVNGIQNGITSGFGDLQTALCGGFGSVNQNISQTGNGIVAAVTGAQNALAQQLYTNEIGSLERSFAAQTAVSQGMNTISSNLQNCCCENRANIADLKYTVATENCADRYEAAQNTQNIITALTAGIQSIKDDLCAERLEAQKRENDNLRSELLYARGQASQVAQTSAIEASQAAQTQYLVNRIAPYPVPAYTVAYPFPTTTGTTTTG